VQALASVSDSTPRRSRLLTGKLDRPLIVRSRRNGRLLYFRSAWVNGYKNGASRFPINRAVVCHPDAAMTPDQASMAFRSCHAQICPYRGAADRP
jgi:hypothetical protein